MYSLRIINEEWFVALERRAKKREDIRTIAEYMPLKAAKTAAGKKRIPSAIGSRLLDISINGCALESPVKAYPGSRLRVRIDPLAFALEAYQARRDPLKMTGRVTSCVPRKSGFRIGIYFTRISSKDRVLIKRFMKIKERRKTPRYLLGSF